MQWWIGGAVIAFIVVRHLWRSYNHPAHTLGRQAANMNWTAAGTVKDEHGFNNLKLRRGQMAAIISFRDRNVRLVEPATSKTFKDFVELEQWVAQQELLANSADGPAENDEAIAYLRQVEAYVKKMGFDEQLLVLQGSDTEYCIASMTMQRNGYLSGESPKVVGALTIDSIRKFDEDRELSLLFLKHLGDKFSAKKQVGPTGASR